MRLPLWPIAGTLLLAATSAGGVGCARPRNPWVYAPPPAVSVNAYARPVSADRTVIAVAQFANPSGLQRSEGNSFSSGANSGVPLVGVMGSRIPGRIQPGTLEMSKPSRSSIRIQTRSASTEKAT